MENNNQTELEGVETNDGNTGIELSAEYENCLTSPENLTMRDEDQSPSDSDTAEEMSDESTNAVTSDEEEQIK